MKNNIVLKIINYASLICLCGLLLYLFVWSFSCGKDYKKIELQLLDDTYTTDFVIKKEAEYKDDNNIVFWCQLDSKELVNLEFNRRAYANVIAVRGDSGLVIHEGRHLLVDDYNVCVVGKQLAFDLFGSVDVVGCKVDYSGKSYTIVDVLSDYDKVFIFQAQQDDNLVFNRLTTLEKDNETKAKCVNRLKVNYGFDGMLIDYEFEFFLIRAMAMLILISLLIYGVFRIKKHLIKKYTLIKRWQTLFGYLIVIVDIIIVVICISKIHLPIDYIPAKWADYSHWVQVFKEKFENFNNLLYAKKNVSDYNLFFCIVKFCTYVAMIIVTAILNLICRIKILKNENVND